MGGPQNGWFRMENPIKMDDLGHPHLRKPPNLNLSMIGNVTKLLKIEVWYKRCTSYMDQNLDRYLYLSTSFIFNPKNIIYPSHL
jgi:hypothetical protein